MSRLRICNWVAKRSGDSITIRGQVDAGYRQDDITLRAIISIPPIDGAIAARVRGGTEVELVVAP